MSENQSIVYVFLHLHAAYAQCTTTSAVINLWQRRVKMWKHLKFQKLKTLFGIFLERICCVYELWNLHDMNTLSVCALCGDGVLCIYMSSIRHLKFNFAYKNLVYCWNGNHTLGRESGFLFQTNWLDIFFVNLIVTREKKSSI